MELIVVSNLSVLYFSGRMFMWCSVEIIGGCVLFTSAGSYFFLDLFNKQKIVVAIFIIYNGGL